MTLPGLTEEEHENLCRRCGSSCHWAVPVNGLPVVVDELHCTYLARDPDGRFRCTVYETRFEVAPWCRTAEQALEHGLLAQDCPYAKHRSGYRGKVTLHPRLQKTVEPAIRAEILRTGVPNGASLAGVLRFLHRTGPETFKFKYDADNERHMPVVIHDVDEDGED